MRVTGVCLFSNNEEIVEFDFQDHSQKVPYTMRAMIGLDAEEIVPRFYGRGTTTKTRYYSPTIGSREIVIRIVLKPQNGVLETYSSLRDKLYKTISSARDGQVEIRFMSDLYEMASIKGFITKFEAPVFSQVPEVQLTIFCEDGIFKSIKSIKVRAAGLSKTKMIITDTTSTSPHGMTFELKFLTKTPYFSIQDVSVVPEWKFKLIPGTIGGLVDFQVNDRLFFSNEGNEKSVFILRGSTQYYLADKIETGSVWPIIFPGENQYTIDYSTGNFSWTAFSYYATYWGI